MTADWSASQYLKFEDQRTRPARDLAAQVPLDSPRKVYDLGCGPGNSTETLMERFPEAEFVGVDSSPDMLDKARKRLPQVKFMQADLARWMPPADADVFYSNATFQWIPDHIPVLQRLLQALPEGGALAVQMPDNVNEPSHRSMREVAAVGPWADRLKDTPREQLPTVQAYYDALRPHARHVDIWHTHYQHPLDGAEAIADWFKGTALRPYLDPLSEAERPEFLVQYKALLSKAYPAQCDGKSLLRFPRLFMLAVR
jgi:trans-aconitate 2-methyltransferase